MTTHNRPVSQTRSFTTVFLIEMWERFGYYGMQALIVYYMVQRLGFADARATLVWGAASALIYVAPAVGGWVGDKVLGTRRTMLTGAFVLAAGYALMAVPGVSTWFLFAALGVIVVGNGLFKANAGNLVRKIYEGDDSKIDSAFTIYYMAVNVGSTASIWLTPWIKNYVNSHYGHGFGWHAAFAICSLGLLVGLFNYLVMRHTLAHIGSEPDQQPFHSGKMIRVLGAGVLAVALSAIILQYEIVARIFVILAGLTVLGIFIYLIRNSHERERSGIAAALVLTLQTVLFFIFYQQMPTSLNLFALRNVNLNFNLFGVHLWTWDPAQLQMLNPVWIFILSPILAWIYTSAGRRDRDISIAAKFALGFAAVSAGFFVYSAAQHFAVGGRTSQWVMVWGYSLTSLGELLISGLGLAVIARYVPARMGGFMMGAYFVAVGCALYVGGLISGIASVPDKVGAVAATAVTPLTAQVKAKLPVVMSLKLDDFRNWMKGQGDTARQHLAPETHLPTFNSLPEAVQHLLERFNQHLFHATMPIYTTLFLWLAVAAVICTVISLASLPLMRRLSAQHHAHNAATDTPLPTIGSEE